MNIPKNFWNTVVGAFAILTVLLAILAIKSLKELGYVGKSDQVVNTITVDGTGDAVAMPDVATFSFSVTETGKTVAEAQAKAADKINAALKAVKDGGVSEKDIKTTSYSINPHYEYQDGLCTTVGCRPGKSVLNGYEVSQSIEVKVRDIGKAGALFGTIGALGVQNVNGLSFSVDKPETVQAEARGAAIKNAQDKAAKLAGQLGVSLVRVVSFSENNNYPRPIPYGLGGADMMVAKTASAAPEVPTGEQKVTENVSITYEIK